MQRLRRRRTGLKRALLDQTLVSGIGNIYADEALWRARLHWAMPTDELAPARARELLGHARDVMAEALAQGGTSFDDLYVNVNGESGLLRPVAGGVRAGRPAVPAVRPADRARGVHEPVVVPLPALPADAEAAAPVSGPVPPDDAAVRVTAWVTGRVQGVGFRWWTRARALELGLAGWARNLDDGRVEVVAEGTAGAGGGAAGAAPGARDSGARAPGGRALVVGDRARGLPGALSPG